MSKLQELYEAREKLKSLGIEPNADLEKQLSELEEKIIRDEIVPIITDKVEPVLKQVKREVVIVVENSPENGINVYLSRKRNVTSALSDAISISSNQTQTSIYNATEPTHHPQMVAEYTRIERPRSSGMKKATVLRVTFPDGTVISDSRAVETLKKCIVKFGPERVAQLCLQPVDSILQLCGVNLVTKRRDNMYGGRQHDIGNGWLVFTCSNTPSKKRQIEAIAKALGIKIRVEIV